MRVGKVEYEEEFEEEVEEEFEEGSELLQQPRIRVIGSYVGERLQDN